MKKAGLDVFKESYNKDFKFYDENILMLSWYGQRVLSTLREKKIKTMISLGIGHKIVSKKIIEEFGPQLEKYLLLEGSREIIDGFGKEIRLPSNVSIIHSLFEDFKIHEKFDAIEMGFVLEHVDDPLSVMKQYANFLRPNGTIFIAVPNAKSLHRIIGFKAGMLDNIYSLSRYDRDLGHKRYFDLESLTEIILQSDLKVEKVEGIFLKPFSTVQLKSLNLSSEILNALCNIGVEYPEISNAIYLEANFDHKE